MSSNRASLRGTSEGGVGHQRLGADLGEDEYNPWAVAARRDGEYPFHVRVNIW